MEPRLLYWNMSVFARSFEEHHETCVSGADFTTTNMDYSVDDCIRTRLSQQY